LNEYELKNFINNFKRIRNGGSIYLSAVPAFAEVATRRQARLWQAGQIHIIRAS